MTTITIERELLKHALEVIAANTLGKGAIKNALRAALAAPATAPEHPSWQDAPTAPGLWVCREATTGNMQAFIVTDPDALNRNLDIDGRWFGPTPEDKA